MSKRLDIMRATLDLIDEEGLQSVTIAKIKKRAGVGSGTLFNYFSTKEELVNEVYRAARLHMSDNILNGYDPARTLYERFKCLQSNRLRFAVAFPKEYMFIDSFSYSPYISPELRHMEDDSWQAVMTLIVEGQQQGVIKEMDAQLCHQLIHGIVSSIVKGYFVHKYPLDDTRVQQTLEASWKAIRV